MFSVTGKSKVAAASHPTLMPLASHAPVTKQAETGSFSGFPPFLPKKYSLNTYIASK